MKSPLACDDFMISQHEGVLEVICKPGVAVGPAELDVLANTITHFRGWPHAPILVHLSRIKHVTPPARQMLLSYRHLGPIALTGEDPVDRVLAAFITQSLSRTRYFTNRAEARTWLGTVAASASPTGLPALQP